MHGDMMGQGEGFRLCRRSQMREGGEAMRVSGDRKIPATAGRETGETLIGAHIKCFDAATKELLLERDVDGRVVMGLMGGKSEGANNGLAKEIAKDVKEKFVK
jgi:hypothetical protein